jgi:DivIVA domain-containing protein
MIDLTPLDVRNKRGDFKKLMRGYDPQEVDVFLEIVADRLEMLTRENMALRERTGALQAQVNSSTDREQAVQAALVTAQELRADIRAQAQREAESILREAETEARRMGAEAEAEARTKLRGAERQLDKLEDAIQQVDRRRARFLKEFRQLLQRELDVVAVEEGRAPHEERTIDLDLGARRLEGPPPVVEVPAPAPPPPLGAPPAPPSAHRQDDLLLYLDPDEGEGRR